MTERETGGPRTMATTYTILVSGTYNGGHTGGPFSVPHGTSQIQRFLN